MDDSDTKNDNVESEDETDDHGDLREARVTSNNTSINSGIEANPKTGVSMISRQLTLHIDMYVLADKYDIVSLGDLAVEKFEEVAKRSGPYSADTKFPVSYPFGPIHSPIPSSLGGWRPLPPRLLTLKPSQKRKD